MIKAFKCFVQLAEILITNTIIIIIIKVIILESYFIYKYKTIPH